MVARDAAAHAAASRCLLLMLLVLLAVAVVIRAHRVLLNLRVALRFEGPLLGQVLLLLPFAQLLPFILYLQFCMVVQINVDVAPAFERFIRVRQELALKLYLSYLLYVISETVRCRGRTEVPLGFFYDLLNDVEFYDFPDVDAVVGPFEDLVLGVVF